MSESAKVYFAMLESLPSEDLDRSAQELAGREKREGARSTPTSPRSGIAGITWTSATRICLRTASLD